MMPSSYTTDTGVSLKTEYDDLGNPTKYLEFDQLSWSGRKLDNIKDGGNLISEYIYDSDGVRVAKYVSGVQTQYIYTNGQLSALKCGDDVLYFTYDGNGTLLSVTYNDAIYYYVLNPQGDVVGLCNASGNAIASYVYDEWGYPISAPTSGIGALNPFRYRGYIYDAETGFYLTGTRYYDPEVGRFINADTTDVLKASPMALTDKNLFAYCDNNPVCRIDTDGRFWEYALVGGGIVSSGISLSGVGTAMMTALGAITPVGWIIIGTVAVTSIAVAGIVYAKGRSKEDVDPYARPGQKKQGRENKNKSRQNENFKSRNNKRNGKPAEPKHHTPGKVHQKYNQSNNSNKVSNAKLNLLFKMIG